MCGIAGFIKHSINPPDLLYRLMETIAHRGPDGKGNYEDEQVGLGHARLSLVDLAGGGQPIHFGHLSIVFNGEIYNYKELRQQLIGQGYVFDTMSDTEVVLKLYHNVGPSFVDTLNGIYGLAIYDRLSGKLLLSRDYFGVKPLHYYQLGRQFAFCSEAKMLLHYLKILKLPHTISTAALKEYLAEGYIEHHPLVNGMYQIAPGSVCEYDLATGNLRQLHQVQIMPRQETTLVDVEREIGNQVSLELQADVEVGVLLSGGIDSSLLTYLVARRQKHLKTFSISYKDNSLYDESEYSAFVANKMRTTHFDYRFTEEHLLQEIPALINCMDYPIYDPAMLPMLYLARNVKQEVKAALSGDGGDELFGGYVPYRAIRYKQFFQAANLLAAPFRKVHRKFGVLNNLLTGLESPKGPFAQNLSQIGYQYTPVHLGSFREAMEHDIRHELLHKLLVKTDLTSMYYGLEVRVPFLSRTVYEYALGLRNKDLVSLRYGKTGLREILSRHFGRKIAYKSKKGFRVPISQWLGHNGALSQKVKESLSRNYQLPEELLPQQFVQQLLDNNNNQDYSTKLFSLFLLNEWISKYK